MHTDDPSHSAAYKIFHYWFDVTIPAMFLIDRELAERFGTYCSGDRVVDQHAPLSMSRARLTIADMAEKFDEGASISLVVPQDAVRIYAYVNEHLLDFKRTHDINYNLRQLPIEDLRKLEAFAKEIYKIARHFMPEGTETSALFTKLNRLGGGRRMRRSNRTEAVVALPAEHNPIMDALTKDHHDRSKTWQ